MRNHYLPVSKYLLMKLNGETTFDLFTIPPGKKKLKEPVLFLDRNSMISKIQDTIADRGFELFFIKKEEQKNFHRLIENCIGMLIKDVNIPLKQKSQVIYQCASNVLSDIFNDARSGENLQRVKDITDHIIQLILNEESAISSLLEISSHDYYTFTHCLNVTVFSIGLFRQIYPGQKQVLQEFAEGCMLHDIGKSKIEAAILSKPDRLTPEEFSVIKKHPEYGCELMGDSVSAISRDIILHHHEKISGKGYPNGLTGNQISDLAKIAAIADVYDALTTRRAYSEARDPFQAMLTMKEEMNGHFEREKFIAFVLLLSGRKKSWIENLKALS